MVTGGPTTWATNRVLLIPQDFASSNSGANVFSFDSLAETVKSADGIELESIASRPY